MKERPILFSSGMVRAILDGSKTQTRRVIPRPLFTDGKIDMPCPYGAPGDRLWCREFFWAYGQWAKNGTTKTGRQKWRFVTFNKQARFEPQPKTSDREVCGWYKRNARFMPRWASRITLEITAVRVERLQHITEEDAKAEGAPYLLVPLVEDGKAPDTIKRHGHRMGFSKLWDSIQLQRSKPKGAFAWPQNPWVYAIEFKRIGSK